MLAGAVIDELSSLSINQRTKRVVVVLQSRDSGSIMAAGINNEMRKAKGVCPVNVWVPIVANEVHTKEV